MMCVRHDNNLHQTRPADEAQANDVESSPGRIRQGKLKPQASKRVNAFHASGRLFFDRDGFHLITACTRAQTQEGVRW